MDFTIDDDALDGETHVIALGGEADLYSAPEFKERLLGLIDAGKTRILIDLSEATFVDSTTLGVLVAAARRVRPEGGTVAIVCAEPSIRKIFATTGLERVFPIQATREEAQAALAEPDTSPDRP